MAAAASITLIEMTNLQEDYTMKRLTAAILALVITLSLCACGATGNTGAASAGNKPKKIEKPVADTLDGILEAIEDDYKTTVQAFRDSLDTINAVIGGDYKNYVKNRQMIDDWYTQVETETAQLFQRTEENCKQLPRTFCGGRTLPL